MNDILKILYYIIYTYSKTHDSDSWPEAGGYPPLCSDCELKATVTKTSTKQIGEKNAFDYIIEFSSKTE